MFKKENTKTSMIGKEKLPGNNARFRPSVCPYAVRFFPNAGKKRGRKEKGKRQMRGQANASDIMIA